MEREERLRREQYRARRNRETAEERIKRLEARSRERRRQNAMMSTEQPHIVAAENSTLRRIKKAS